MAPSVVGTRTISRHFPAGFTGSATLLIRSDKVDFSSAEGSAMIARLTDELTQQRDQLMIADIRSLTAPLGSDPVHDQALGAPGSLVAKMAHLKALEHYVSRAEPDAGHTTQLEIVFAFDPFSRDIPPSITSCDFVWANLPFEGWPNWPRDRCCRRLRAARSNLGSPAPRQGLGAVPDVAWNCIGCRSGSC